MRCAEGDGRAAVDSLHKNYIEHTSEKRDGRGLSETSWTEQNLTRMAGWSWRCPIDMHVGVQFTDAFPVNGLSADRFSSSYSKRSAR